MESYTFPNRNSSKQLRFPIMQMSQPTTKDAIKRAAFARENYFCPFSCGTSPAPRKSQFRTLWEMLHRRTTAPHRFVSMDPIAVSVFRRISMKWFQSHHDDRHLHSSGGLRSGCRNVKMDAWCGGKETWRKQEVIKHSFCVFEAR